MHEKTIVVQYVCHQTREYLSLLCAVCVNCLCIFVLSVARENFSAVKNRMESIELVGIDIL